MAAIWPCVQLFARWRPAQTNCRFLRSQPLRGEFEGTGWLCIQRSSRSYAGCFFSCGSQLHLPALNLSAKPPEALTGPCRFPAKTATPPADGAPSAPCRSLITTKRSIHCGVCTKKCNARSATSSRCLPTPASSVKTVMPIYTSGKWERIARGVTRCSAGMSPSNKLRITRIGSRCWEPTPRCNARIVTKAPLSGSSRASQRLAHPAI